MNQKSEVVLRLSSNMVGNNETIFPHKLLLTDRQFQKFVNLLQIIHQPILSYQRPIYQR